MRVLWALAAEQDRTDIVDFMVGTTRSLPSAWMSFSRQRSADWPSTARWDGPDKSRAPGH
jgi:hypothetical protein